MLSYVNTRTEDPLELIEQCLALAGAVISIDNAAVKESLQMILHEKVSALFCALYEKNMPEPA
ncbi:hypothetical protein SOASR030_30250 [Leminorella grimontii]|uniref:Uncharacterized protein n=1 Tax=Leminorella grimontii TaxID=82981 RepID=A0AAV5N610_9GAMM|nr:hypothetical protein [Leminorella grimontii]KFC94947.1 hypothetical protein GLGR_2379 [Leminorella grimontii ATCC 33999 = DSM 5078]GKX56913.1 hypothetical protein SOASR030_30250 [Leminorella grimontii]VFS61145.1 Uncharacterised protein [Leminorella grimontii]